ncbi:NAD(P)/FAD-dependent oxidoreductase [Brachymonas denitrificans]|uniref:NAD(P)/FAD-dependent oxidoreductase n=1 Tax=Brachymonas denitrificans TaxID=28220 RepID=UPI00321FD005
MSTATFDAVIIGAGAAGLFCAAQAAQRGVKVLLLDHATKLAEKIRISGGGRCNFTNVNTGPANYLSQNPHFCRSALSRYTAQDFMELVQRHGIAFHEKHKGQLFCDRSAGDIIDMLLRECEAAGVTRWQPCAVQSLAHDAAQGHYVLQTARGEVHASSVVLACGGLSIPKIGATDLAWRLAEQFGLRTVPPRPGLVPLTFDATAWQPFAALSGVSLPVEISVEVQQGKRKQRMRFNEDLLFTHRGLSGPAILQISNYWLEGQPLQINLIPDADSALPDAPQREPLLDLLLAAKARGSRKLVANEIGHYLPSRLLEHWMSSHPGCQRPLAETADKALQQLCQSLQQWHITPNGSEGYAKAEVTLGGIDTRDVSSQTMETRQPGLYVIGEAVDVTGWLGGYNFQWAWASAHACAEALAG